MCIHLAVKGTLMVIFNPSLITMGVALGILFLAFWLLLREHQRRGRRPFSEHPLRPPGESLRIKMMELNDRLFTRLGALAVVFAPMMILVHQGFTTGNTALAVSAAAVGIAIMLGLTLWVWKAAVTLGNYSLGFDGERAVGEELNRLMLEGCQVFHDLEMDRRGNIDHVVVAPHGVYAIETKTRRKMLRVDPGDKSHEATYDGANLIYPNGSREDGIEQARKNAIALAKRLEEVTGKTVPVSPILVLPGWWVERRKLGDVNVVNSDQKQLRSAILGKKATPMTAETFDLIVRNLNRWSRDSMKSVR